LKRILIILSLTISQLFFSQEKITIKECDSLNSGSIINMLDFEGIKFKNYILKNLDLKKKKIKINYYQYFNNIEVIKGELKNSHSIISNQATQNDSTYNIKLFIKSLSLNNIKVQFFTDYQNTKSKTEPISFTKFENKPSKIDFGNKEFENFSSKQKIYFRILIGYVAGRDSNEFDIIQSFMSFKKFQPFNHTFDEDWNYFVFEFEIE